MTAKDRDRHEANLKRQDPQLPTELRVPVRTDTWLARGTPSVDPGIVWLKRPMPDGGWPADQRLPRDDSFSWWIRSTCGHQGGARQWAFYEERYADMYEQLFRDDPCRYSRCPEWTMRSRRG